MKTIGRNMAIGGAAIVGAFAIAIKTASQFEQSMANTASVAGATTEELKTLSDYARKMGEQSVFSASQAADAMYYLASAGMNTTEIMGALEGTLALAAATASDLAYTSESVAATLSQFGLAADESGRVANVFAAAISGSQATMEKLTTSMSYVGPMAKSMGMSIEDTTGVLMNLYNAGLDGSMAGTALRMAFAQLIQPTNDGAAALDNLKVSIKDSNGEMRPFKDIIDDLGTAGMSTADAMDIFGKRAGPAMMALVAQGSGAIAEMTDKITGTDKATEMAAMQIDTFQGAIKLLKSAFEELQITLVQDLMPALKGTIEWITEGIKKVTEWMKANPELTATIVKWAGAIGALMLVLGPLLMILPGLIAGITLLSSAFLPFLVGGLIIAGLIKLNSLLDDMNEKVYKAQVNFDNLSVAEIDKEIESLAQEIKRLEEQIKTTSELPLSSSAQFGSLIDTKNAVMNLEMKMGLLIEKREELTKAEKDGIDVTETKLKLDKDIADIQDEINRKLKEGEEALKAKNKVLELTNIQQEIGNKIYKLTHTAMEIAIKDLDEQKEAYIKAGASIEDINKWYDLEIKKLKKVNKESDDNVDIMKKVKDITKAVTDTIYRLTHQPYEVIIRGINEEYDDYIREVKEAKLGTDEERKAIEQINEARTIEIAKVDQTTEAEKKATEQKNKLEDAYKTLGDRIYELTHTAMENNIKKLEEQRLANIAMGVSVTDANKLYDLEIAKLSELGNAFTTLQETVKPIITAITGYLEDNLANAIYNLLSGTDDIEFTWESFWEGLKDILIKAVAAMIAKLVVLAAFSWLFNLLGIPVGWLGNKGGGVGYEKGGNIEGFAKGGSSTDTVPAMLTPGEYVISKPMVDFIKRTGAVTSDLVGAIRSGARTPTASFAGGGGVGASDNRKTYSSTIQIQPGAIVINTPKFGEGDAQNMFRLIERQARNRGLKFATN